MNTAEKQQAIDAAVREMIDTPYEVTKAQQEKELQEAATAIRAAERPTARYSIFDATVLLLAETGEWIKLHRPVAAGEIKSYAPGREVHTVRPAHANVLDSEELYQDDINAWLDSNYPRLSFRFGTKPPPAKVVDGDTANEGDATLNQPHKKGTKWTDDELNALRRNHKAGKTQEVLAEFHGVKRQCISKVLQRANTQFAPKRAIGMSMFGIAKRTVTFGNDK